VKRRRLGVSIAAAAVPSTAAESSASCSPSVNISPRDEWFSADIRRRLHSTFESATPFPHVVIRPFLGEAGLRAVRADIEKVAAREKETDLFRFFQTAELGGVAGSSHGTTGGARPSVMKRRRKRSTVARAAAATMGSAPSLVALARFFGSSEFRVLSQDITHCGELSDRIDLAAQVYTRGGHLLCHDDVIGTRKVSFIYYMTDPEEEWRPEEGGALELYPMEPGAPHGTPATSPVKELLPLADSLAMFITEPGVSFHSVREVRGSRARVALQGWVHAPSLELTASFGRRGAATLSQILGGAARRPAISGGAIDKASADSCGSAHAVAGEHAELTAVAEETPQAPATTGTTVMRLTPEDVEFLSQWISAEYLVDAQLETVAERFADSSYAALKQFLRADIAGSLATSLSEADRVDGFGPGAEEPAVPEYQTGVVGGWALVGPPHLQRYLRFPYGRTTTGGEARGSGFSGEGNSLLLREVAEECGEKARPPQQRLGSYLRELARGLFGSGAFRRWLQICTRLEPRDAGHVEIRRFRPGLDYTVAAHASSAVLDAAELDATLAVVDDSAADVAARWQGEDVGGFESYVEADDEGATVEAQERYRGADTDGPLVNLPAASNTLCLVMRDTKTLRFVKYLSRDAPSSRVDIAASYVVDAPAESSCSDASPSHSASPPPCHEA